LAPLAARLQVVSSFAPLAKALIARRKTTGISSAEIPMRA